MYSLLDASGLGSSSRTLTSCGRLGELIVSILLDGVQAHEPKGQAGREL
jgi:hypothetical protein